MLRAAPRVSLTLAALVLGAGCHDFDKVLIDPGRDGGGGADAPSDTGAGPDTSAGEDAARLDAGADAPEPDSGPTADAAPTDDAGVIEPPSCAGFSRIVDDFDGAALGAHWTPAAVGAAPTYSVAGSWLRITDASTADTPSNPGLSWIYSLAEDRGNQMTWAQPLGTGDFRLFVRFDWASEPSELTMAGIGVVDGAGYIHVLAGFTDDRGGAAGVGTPFVCARTASEDAVWRGDSEQTGSGTFLIERTGDALTAHFDGAEVLTSTTSADIAALAVVTVRHRTAAGDVPAFGEFGVDLIVLCR